MTKAEERLKKYLSKNQNEFDDCFYEGDLDSDIKQVLNMLEQARELMSSLIIDPNGNVEDNQLCFIKGKEVNKIHEVFSILKGEYNE